MHKNIKSPSFNKVILWVRKKNKGRAVRRTEKSYWNPCSALTSACFVLEPLSEDSHLIWLFLRLCRVCYLLSFEMQHRNWSNPLTSTQRPDVVRHGRQQEQQVDVWTSCRSKNTHYSCLSYTLSLLSHKLLLLLPRLEVWWSVNSTLTIRCSGLRGLVSCSPAPVQSLNLYWQADLK